MIRSGRSFEGDSFSETLSLLVLVWTREKLLEVDSKLGHPFHAGMNEVFVKCQSWGTVLSEEDVLVVNQADLCCVTGCAARRCLLVGEIMLFR